MATQWTPAGEFSQRCTLLAADTLTDPATGEAVETFSPVAEDFLKIQPLTARETVFARQANMQMTGKARIRYRTDINERWRIQYCDPRGTHTLAIDGLIDIDNRHIELELATIEVR